MTRTRQYYDVFLSYALGDRPVAEAVKKALTQAGLAVFDASAIQPGQEIGERVRHALATSEALVAVIASDGATSSNVAVEIGAAMAWNKPIYILQEKDGVGRLPEFLSSHRAYPLSRVDDVVGAIRRGRQPLSEADRDVLRQVYEEMRTPTDQFLNDPAQLDELASRFARRTGTRISGERLLSEMIRLRKQGRWPRLKQTG